MDLDKDGQFLKKKLGLLKSNPIQVLQGRSNKNLPYANSNEEKGKLPYDQMNSNFFKNFADDIAKDSEKKKSMINYPSNSLKFDSNLNLNLDNKKKK